MAMRRRLHALLQMRSRAVAAARASRSPHPAPAARAARAHRSPPRGFLGDAMAAARGRGQASRACAVARIRAIGAEVEADTSAAVARIRAIGAEVEAGARAAVACAHARARAAQEYFLHAQRQGGAAAAVAGKRLRKASDATIYGVLLVLYGESAPWILTPTMDELLVIMELLHDKLKKIRKVLSLLLEALELFEQLDEDQQTLVLAIISAPIALAAALLCCMIPSDTVSTAPEPICAFVDIDALPLGEYPVQDCLFAVAHLSATCGAVLVMWIGGIVLSVPIGAYELLEMAREKVTDMIKGKTAEEIRKNFNIKNGYSPEEDVKIAELLELTCEKIAHMIKGKTPEEIRKTFNIKNDFTAEEEEELHKIAHMIKGKTPEEIRKTFNIKNVWTPQGEEEVREESQWAFE